MRSTSLRSTFILAALVAASGLAACGPTTTAVDTPAAPNAAPGASAAPAPAAPAISEFKVFRWYTADTSKVLEAGPPAKLGLTGYISAVFDELAVKSGQTVVANFSASGPEGRTLRSVLTRHCQPENGEDAQGNECKLTPAGSMCTVETRFTKDYSCVRLDFTPSDGQPLEVTISDVVLTRK